MSFQAIICLIVRGVVRVAVKNHIMDGKVVVGVGNIYAAESLFMAKIRPATAAQRVSRVAYENLAQAIRQILARAIKVGGTTLRDFVGFRRATRVL